MSDRIHLAAVPAPRVPLALLPGGGERELRAAVALYGVDSPVALGSGDVAPVTPLVLRRPEPPAAA